MRLWHILFAVAVVGVGISLCREPTSRVFVIVLSTGIGEIATGLACLMALFQSIGGIGEAKGLTAHVEAIATTTVVLGFSTLLMSAWLFVAGWLIQTFV